MTSYILLDSDEKIREAVEAWKESTVLSVDFEGEFNLHIYGEHLCLVQIYDGASFYILDPRSKNVSKKGLECFFSSPFQKLWFDCQSDSSLVYKEYNLTIARIFDLRVLAQCLGQHSNLTSLIDLYLGIPSSENKKKNQQSNWLIRPIPAEQLEYALNDVRYLAPLKEKLVAEIEKNGLWEQVEKGMKAATAIHQGKPGWTKVGPWKTLNGKEKVYLKNIFIARDLTARRFNVPASWVLDKHRLIDYALSIPRDKKTCHGLSQNGRFEAFFAARLEEALVKAQEEWAQKSESMERRS